MHPQGRCLLVRARLRAGRQQRRRTQWNLSRSRAAAVSKLLVPLPTAARPSAAGTAATQGSRFASQQPGQNAAGAAQHAAARNIPRIDTEDIPRMSADAPRTQPATDYRTGGAATAPTSQAASSQASSAGASGDDFYDFNLPYGSDDGNDDGLIRHRHSKKRRRKRHIIIAVLPCSSC